MEEVTRSSTVGSYHVNGADPRLLADMVDRRGDAAVDRNQRNDTIHLRGDGRSELGGA